MTLRATPFGAILGLMQARRKWELLDRLGDFVGILCLAMMTAVVLWGACRLEQTQREAARSRETPVPVVIVTPSTP